MINKKLEVDNFNLVKSKLTFSVGMTFLLTFSILLAIFGKNSFLGLGEPLFVGLIALATLLCSVAFIRLQLRVCMLSTELRRATEEEEFERHRMLTLINSVKDAVILVDEAGYISLYNAATLDILNTNVGISREPVAGVVKDFEDELDLKGLMQDLSGSKEVKFNYEDQKGSIQKMVMTVSRAKSGYGKIGMRGFVLLIRSVGETAGEEKEGHELRGLWAAVEGSVENSTVMLQRGNAKGAEKALGMASKALTRMKPKIIRR